MSEKYDINGSFLRANSFHLFKIRYPKMLSIIVKVDTAKKIRYVFQGVTSYAPLEPTTAAAEMNCEAKKASVVIRVSQPAMLIQPTAKLYGESVSL